MRSAGPKRKSSRPCSSTGTDSKIRFATVVAFSPTLAAHFQARGASHYRYCGPSCRSLSWVRYSFTTPTGASR